MIARLLFPTFASHLADGSQVLVAVQALGLGVGVLPNARSLSRRNNGSGPFLAHGLVAGTGVIAAVGSHGCYGSFGLREQVGQDFAVGIVVGRDAHGHD